VEQRHAAEVKRLKSLQEASNKLKQEKWMDEKTKRIKVKKSPFTNNFMFSCFELFYQTIYYGEGVNCTLESVPFIGIPWTGYLTKECGSYFSCKQEIVKIFESSFLIFTLTVPVAGFEPSVLGL
jgi:hypothetical protein